MFCTPVLIAVSLARWSDNHLSAPSGAFRSVRFQSGSSPTIVWVSRSWGLPRSTLTVSGQTPSLWHFQEACTISEDLGTSSAVNLRCLHLSFRVARSLQPSQAVRAWTFLKACAPRLSRPHSHFPHCSGYVRR